MTQKISSSKQNVYLQKYYSTSSHHAVSNMILSTLVYPLQEWAVSQRSQNTLDLCKVGLCHSHEVSDLHLNFLFIFDKACSSAFMYIHNSILQNYSFLK